MTLVHASAREVLRRIEAALRRWPDRAGWVRVAAELAWGLPIIAALGWVGALMTVEPADDLKTVVTTVVILFFVPALGEETLFRGALLDPARPSPVRFIIAVSLFVLWHPLQAVTGGPPWAAMFLDPWFLAATGALGALLGRIYLATASLWPCILIHWSVVAAWKLLLGGPF